MELAKGIGSLPGWCKGVHRKKTETHRKIIEGSRKAYQELGRRLTVAESPRMAVDPPVPSFRDVFGDDTVGIDDCTARTQIF
ncbi:hypothetical protein BHM03_00052072 [Ensete ventricosum]|nr:hypothetical protein BHM03_00052072 [Ensete ventricosum]